MQTNSEQGMTGQQGQQQMSETNQQQFLSATNRDCQRRYNLHHINIEITTQCTCTACFGASTPSRLPFASKKLLLDTQMLGLLHTEIQSFAQDYIKQFSSQFQDTTPPIKRYCQQKQQQQQQPLQQSQQQPHHNAQPLHANQRQHIHQPHHDIHQQQQQQATERPVVEASSQLPAPTNADANSIDTTGTTSGNSPSLDIHDEDSYDQEANPVPFAIQYGFDAPSLKESMDRMRQLVVPENYHLEHSPQRGDCVCLLGSVFSSRTHADVLGLLERWRLSDPQTRMGWKWSENDLPLALSGRANLKALGHLRQKNSGFRADLGDYSGASSGLNPAKLSGAGQFLLILYCMHGHPGRKDKMQKEGYCPHCFAKVSAQEGGYKSNTAKLVFHFKKEHTETSVRGRPSSISALRTEEPLPHRGSAPPFFSNRPSVTEVVEDSRNSIHRQHLSNGHLPSQVSNKSMRPDQTQERFESSRQARETPSTSFQSTSPSTCRHSVINSSSGRGDIDKPSQKESARREAILSKPTYHVNHALEDRSCGCLVGSKYLDKSITKRHVLERLERWRKLNIADRLAWKWRIDDLPENIQTKNVERVERSRSEYSGGRNNFGGTSGMTPTMISGVRQLLLMLYCLRGHPGRDDPMQREGYCPHCFARTITTNGLPTLSRVINHFMKHVDRTV